ncbi:MAG TPA: hypothetical protein PLB56_01805 [Spirochaetales bacterium]|nr:hypothetical protein [Spirochaetales bacterium]
MRSQLVRTALASLAAAAAAAAIFAEGGTSLGDPARPGLSGVPGTARSEPYRLFPRAYRPDPAPAVSAGPADHHVPDEAEYAAREAAARSQGQRVPVLANSDILSFYGHPTSRRMGILGEYPKDQLTSLLSGYAQLFDAANGDRDVIPAFHLIYGTCWPEGEIGYLSSKTVEEYVRFAAERGMLVFLDHQIGKYTVEESVRRLLPFLRYPNVHLALDPEWRTLQPMKEIGSVTAAEINRAQELMQAYLTEHGLPGVRILVFHQFTEKMIQDRSRVRADFDRVLPVHVMDGFGPPALKRYSYALNSRAANLPLKGFKLFFKSGYPGAGFDEPLMTPQEVLGLAPAPVLIMYQ